MADKTPIHSDLGASRLATIDVEFAQRGAAAKRFIARAFLQVREE